MYLCSLNLPALIKILESHFGLHLSRIKCLALFVFALVERKTVNLSELKIFFNSQAHLNSRQKRLRRFLKEIIFDECLLARFLIFIMNILFKDKLTLILDRTNWKFGSKNCNILYLAVKRGQIAVPLFWIVLEDQKQGNSSCLDRINLVQKFISAFGKETIECILGDREFIGKNWVTWLQTEKIPFIMRIKEKGQYVSCARGGMIKAENLFHDLLPEETRYLGPRRISQTDTYRADVSGKRTLNGETLVVIHSPNLKDPIETYKSRWEIERFFKAIKKVGFNLEDTHITSLNALHTLLGVVAIAFCFVYKFGEVLEEIFPQKLKKHGYKSESVSHYGHANFIQIIRNSFILTKRVALRFLSIIKCSLFFNVLDLTKTFVR